jgi:hypothetical protein
VGERREPAADARENLMAHRLSVDEYLNARFRDFAVIDANHDDSITKDELEAAGRGQGSTR